jgi:biopolymer transport protein ExbB
LPYLFFIGVLAVDACALAHGQTSGAGAEAAPAIHAKTVADWWRQGGVAMYFLGLASVLMLTFAAEGMIKFTQKRMAPQPLVAALRQALQSGHYQEALNRCKEQPSYLSAVLAAGLERIGRGKQTVDFAVEEASLREGALIKSNLAYLSVIGVVSPMIGLAGTVFGMIKAFSTIGASGIADPLRLGEAIGEVLIATASGLIIAIPAFIFYHILKTKANGEILRANARVYQLLEDIPYHQVEGVRFVDGQYVFPEPAEQERILAHCPGCSAGLSQRTGFCPHCGAHLEWSIEVNA